MSLANRRHASIKNSAVSAAAERLLDTYAGLAERGAHLFEDLLAGQLPQQWRHYPVDDAIDLTSGFQWFYHSHAPGDRAAAVEHGHLHLFARRKRWARRLRSTREIEFSMLEGVPASTQNTRHLLAIGFDAKGIPKSIFTVNSWVTGDRMLSADLTLQLLATLRLDTGNKAVDAVVESLVCLFHHEIRALLLQRDHVLFAWQGGMVLSQEKLEVLSETALDVDQKLRQL